MVNSYIDHLLTIKVPNAQVSLYVKGFGAAAVHD